ncbi:MAG TPA: PPK2 family polyphosphate kinase [Baekduia sp.]|nr:PPK2 family polyphosphate kinase [Baekduia sp.]
MDFAKRYIVDQDGFDLSARPTRDKNVIDKRGAERRRAQDVSALAELQGRLYAENERSLLIVLQALDAAGKDSTTKHVMTGVNPQGVRVTSFKEPTREELGHPFLWRVERAAPRRGEIGIFNRSHYEDVLVVRVHPEYLAARDIDPALGAQEEFWQERFDQIRAWERRLGEEGTEVLKFFLHVGRAEQRKRFLARAEDPTKHWKFSAGDVAEREHYDDYQRAYQDMLVNTSTKAAPWYVVPADQKWLTRTAVASIIRARLEAMDPRWPVLSEQQQLAMDAAVAKLRAEG